MAFQSGLDLDTHGSEALARITRFAAQLCETPVALVSIVDAERHHILAKVGLDLGELPREHSFCARAMLAPELFIVPDAARDPRFAGNPLIGSDPHIRFYAGSPLRSPEGAPLGALCVIDHAPRAGLTPVQTEGLAVLAGQATHLLGLHQRERASHRHAESSARALADSENRFRILADSMPQMVWSALPDGYNDYFNARWYEFTGTPEGSSDGEGWHAVFHPEDQPHAWDRWRRSLATGEPYEIEYRMRHHSGEYRWTLGRALPMRDDQGQVVRWFGTCTDIHEQKLALEERELVAHELSHRIKNIFSVIGGLIGLSAREHPEIRAAADDLRERVMTLGRAHDYVRPHSSRSGLDAGQDSLKALLAEIFAPYRSGATSRIALAGEDWPIDDRSATPIALTFHELATNAAKYGALAHPDGRVRLEIRRDDADCLLDWREEGGPPVAAAPATSGFGGRLIALSAERQLGGRIERQWDAEGLRVRLYIPARSMSRNAGGTG